MSEQVDVITELALADPIPASAPSTRRRNAAAMTPAELAALENAVCRTWLYGGVAGPVLVCADSAGYPFVFKPDAKVTDGYTANVNEDGRKITRI